MKTTSEPFSFYTFCNKLFSLVFILELWSDHGCHMVMSVVAGMRDQKFDKHERQHGFLIDMNIARTVTVALPPNIRRKTLIYLLDFVAPFRLSNLKKM